MQFYFLLQNYVTPPASIDFEQVNTGRFLAVMLFHFSEFFGKKNRQLFRIILFSTKSGVDSVICTSNLMFGSAIWDKLPECIFENFEIARAKQR